MTEKQTSPPARDSNRPERHTSRYVLLAVAGIAFVGLGISVAEANELPRWLWPMFVVCAGLLIPFSYLMRVHRKAREIRRWTPEDEVYHAEEALTDDDLLGPELASLRYEPRGTWKATDVGHTNRSDSAVARMRAISERQIEFGDDGRGRYRHLADGVAVETLFAFKRGLNPYKMRVRLLLPIAQEDWTTVQFGYEGSPGDMAIWFDADSPLPPEHEPYWPFWGVLNQAKEPVAGDE